MKKGIFFVFLGFPLFIKSQDLSGLEKDSLIQIIYILAFFLALVLGWEVYKYFRKHQIRPFASLFSKTKLEVELEKDKIYRPQLLTMTIRNTGKKELEFHTPVLEFRKIWSKRKFRLNGINGNHIYPMYIGCGLSHQLRIETSTFYQYDRSIKSYYWAQIIVRDVKGRKFNSNKVKLRKSLVT